MYFTKKDFNYLTLTIEYRKDISNPNTKLSPPPTPQKSCFSIKTVFLDIKDFCGHKTVERIFIFIMGMLYICTYAQYTHDDVIKWKHFPRNWPFVRGIHRSPVNSPHKGQWRGALMFSLICVWVYHWVNNREAGIWDAIGSIMTSL